MDLDFFSKAFVGFFVLLGPLETAAIFISLTTNYTVAKKKQVALRSSTAAFCVLLIFIFLGANLLKSIGISLYSLRISGGIFLLLIAIQMLFSGKNSANEYGDKEQEEASQQEDVTIFPLAIPLQAGAGSISFATLLSTEAQGNIERTVLLIVVLLLVLSFSYLCMRVFDYVQDKIGKTFLKVFERLAGLLLGALAVQFIIDGIKSAKLF